MNPNVQSMERKIFAMVVTQTTLDFRVFDIIYPTHHATISKLHQFVFSYTSLS